MLTVFLCLTSLFRFMVISINDVPALTQVLGPDIKKFRGVSNRIDEVVEKILSKLPTAKDTSHVEDDE